MAAVATDTASVAIQPTVSNLRNGVRGQKCVSVSDWINLLTYPITDSDTFLRRLLTRANYSQSAVQPTVSNE